MELRREVRRQVLVEKLSKRAACQKYGPGWQTLKKMLTHEEPPGYRQSRPRPKRKPAPCLPILERILAEDLDAPRKQRHTVRRLFQRLRDEHGYTGGLTVVQDAIREWRQSRQEVFLPLSHPPGEAQVDFGEAVVELAGERLKVALFEKTQPYSGAIFVQAFPRECSETFLEGHRRAFECFGGVPQRISYDNSAIAVIEVGRGRERTLTQEFLRLQSHYLFREHFCLVRRANEKGHVERLSGYARVLRLLERFSVEQLAGAVEYALDLDVIDVDSIRTIAEHRAEQPVELFRLDGRPHLARVRVEATDVSAYQALLSTAPTLEEVTR